MARLMRRSHNRAVPKLEPRIVLLSALMAAVLGVICIRVYYLQIIKGPVLAELAERNRIRLRRLPAPRGLVFDRRHRTLIDTRPSFDAMMTPEDAKDLSGTIERLEKVLGGDRVTDKLAQAEEESRPPFEPVAVEENLDWRQVVALETHQLELPGVSLQVTPRRHYLYGPLAAHLLGYVGEATETDLRSLADYHMGDEIGKFGLESSFEPFLRGSAGGDEIEVDALGRRLRLLKEIPDTPGYSVVLTIDLDVQAAAERAMAGKSGALVAIEPSTGRIIAMVSEPAFDPNDFASGLNKVTWRKLTTDRSHPLQNRAIQGIYPPGSVFKLVDTIAGLQEGTLRTNTSYFCPGGMWYGGREYRCWRKQGHGTIALHHAIVASCDVYFYNVAQRLGVDRIAKWAHLLGLGVPTGIELDNERPGVIPSSQWKRKRFHERWYPAETLSVAIGQGYVALTPMELAQLAAEIANGGVRYKPQFVERVEGLDGSLVKYFEPVVEGRANINAQVLAIVRDAMADVVNSPSGTAHMARLPNVTVCGKTGTAQVVKQAQGTRTAENQLPLKYRDHGWFVAYAPKEAPRIAIACVIEHGGHGGSSAAPVVHDVLQRFFELYPPQPAGAPEVPRRVSALKVAEEGR